MMSIVFTDDGLDVRLSSQVMTAPGYVKRRYLEVRP
jgi:hypothetical protein